MDNIFLDRSDTRHRFHIMIKPIGALCNLDCAYCYYLHKTELLNRDLDTRSIMSDETLELFIKQYLKANESQEIVFSWQGGEPTLLGIDFFKKALSLQEKYASKYALNTKGRVVANTIQTNGTLITDDFAKFLKDNDFLVGLSVDGTEEEHNRYRYDKHGIGSFSRLMKGLEYLHKYDVNFNTLTTVNRYNAKKPLEVYRFLTNTIGSNYVQFNPCVELNTFTTTAPHFWDKEKLPKIQRNKPSKGKQGTSKNKTSLHRKEIENYVTDWSVLPEDWGNFLCTIFDEWIEKDLGKVLVNWFETAVAQTLQLPAQICTTGNLCGKGVALEHDGSLYSCDHYVNKEYCLGNIKETHIRELVFSKRQYDFAFKKQNELAQECLQCPHGTLCWGQCPRHRFVLPLQNNGLYAGNIEQEQSYPINYLCSGFKKFYSHAKPQIREIAQQCL